MSQYDLGEALDPTKIFDRLVVAGEDWSDKEAAASLLEETRKSLLARLTLQFSATCKSHAAAEDSARCTDEYGEHVASMIGARRDANKARVKYDAAKIYIDMMRSMNANRRVEMERLGYAP